MFDPQMALVSKHLARIVGELEQDTGNSECWVKAQQAIEAAREQESELASAVDARDIAALRSIIAQWESGQRQLPEQDREVLKRAMKAFRKSLKITRLDAESTIAGGPMSAGRQSGILGITPPSRYPSEVWIELARQGRLIHAKHGVYELPPE